MNDLNTQLLTQYLSKHSFQYHPSLESTNTQAQRWLADDAPDGAVVVADEQVNGRGRLSRRWQTPAGQAIAMSVIWRRSFSQKELERLTMAHSLAIAEVLDKYTEQSIRLKWPNDILLNGQKVCGILIEVMWQGNTLAGVVAGIGINVRVDFSTNPVLASIATSLEDYSDTQIHRSKLISECLENLEHWLDDLSGSTLFYAYQNKLVTLGQTVHLKTSLGQVVGVAEEIDDSGALLVRLETNQLMRVTVGDIVA